MIPVDTCRYPMIPVDTCRYPIAAFTRATLNPDSNPDTNPRKREGV